MSFWTKFAVLLNTRRHAAIALVVPNPFKRLCSSIVTAQDVKEVICTDLDTAENIWQRGVASKDAAECVMTLGLQNNFPLDVIALELVLEKKFHSVMRYFEENPNLQKQFAKLVDDWIAKLNENPELKINGKKTSPRVLYKFLSTFISHNKLAHELCPNLHKIRLGGALNMLMRKKLEQSITGSAWEEIATSTVQNDVVLQKELIQKLIFHNDIKTAVKMAKKFNISTSESPFDSLPSEELCLSDEKQEDIGLSDVEENDSNTFEAVEYLTLDLDFSKIKFVTTEEGFLQCLEDISKDCQIVGIDSEWKPTFRSRRTRLSLVQLAVSDQVYILDMLALTNCLSEAHWCSFVDKFLANPNVLKLGCGVIQDVQMFIEDFKGNKEKIIKFSNVLDISLLYQKMEKLFDNGDENADSPSCNMKGLSKLCHIILGNPLNKGGRFCNWEERPLSDTQITYAALDAYCLLQMFQCMKMQAKELDKNFDTFLNMSLIATTAMSKVAVKNNRNLKWIRTDHSFSYAPILAIMDFKVVVDSKLEDLGLKLRMYGADVVIKEASEICDNYNKIIHDEKRILIGTLAIKEKIQERLPRNKFYIVNNDCPANQNIVAFIFQYFNVQMSSTAIFSRCMRCNGIEFQEMLSDDLRHLWTIQNRPESDNITDHSEEICEATVNDSSSGTNEICKVKIQMQNLTADVFSKVNVFKVCTKCGNVHFQR